MIDEKQIFARKARIPWRVIDEEVVIVDLTGNTVLQLNETGRTIWEKIDGTTTLSGIIDGIVEEFETDRKTASSDTIRFIDLLSKKELIHEVSPEI